MMTENLSITLLQTGDKGDSRCMGMEPCLTETTCSASFKKTQTATYVVLLSYEGFHSTLGCRTKTTLVLLKLDSEKTGDHEKQQRLRTKCWNLSSTRDQRCSDGVFNLQ
jgi:hypothetical protein